MNFKKNIGKNISELNHNTRQQRATEFYACELSSNSKYLYFRTIYIKQYFLYWYNYMFPCIVEFF